MSAVSLTLLTLVIGSSVFRMTPVFAEESTRNAGDTALQAEEGGAADGQAEEPDRAAGVLEEVVVYAQKRDQTLQDVPVAVTAFTTEQLEQKQILGIEDLANNIPNLVLGQLGGTGQITIRGVGYGMITGVGQNSVATYKDGVYISAPQASIMLQSDMARVEVLRGPQGTLWGRNATGGLIHIISPTPSYQFEAGFSLLAGNFERNKQTAFVTGPLGDNLTGRVSLSNDDRGGYYDNLYTGGTEGEVHSKSANLAFDYSATDKLSFDFRSFTTHEDFGGPAWQVLLGEGETPFILLEPGSYELKHPYKLLSDFGFDADRELSGGSVKVSYTINDELELVSISGYTDFKLHFLTDTDGSSSSILTTDRGSATETILQEFNLIGSTDKTDWVLGLFYLTEEVKSSVSGNATFSPTISLYIDSHALEETDSFSLFGDITYAISDVFRVFGGLRYIRDKKDYQFTQITEPRLAIELVPICEEPVKQDLDDQEMTGRVGAQYDLFDNSMVYGSYSSGYKAGGFSGFDCNSNFKPEKLNALEVGIKSTLLEQRVKTAIAAYVYDYQDLQLEETNGIAVLTRNGDADILGLEIEVSALLTDSIEMNASLSLNDAEYGDLLYQDDLDPDPNRRQNQKGNEVMRTPDWAANIGLSHTLPLSRGGKLISAVNVTLSDSYQNRIFEAKMDETEAYELYDLFLTYLSSDNSVKISAYAKNIDDHAVLSGTVNGNGIRLGGYNIGRTYGVEFAYHYR